MRGTIKSNMVTATWTAGVSLGSACEHGKSIWTHPLLSRLVVHGGYVREEYYKYTHADMPVQPVHQKHMQSFFLLGLLIRHMPIIHSQSSYLARESERERAYYYLHYNTHATHTHAVELAIALHRPSTLYNLD